MSNERSPDYLSLEDWVPDRSVMRRFPADLAWRYRALPVAHDRSGATVVMADPDDQAAREAVCAALATGNAAQGAAALVTLVRGDPAVIHRWLAELFPQPSGDETVSRAGEKREIWLRTALHGDGEHVVSYAEALATLLGASLRQLNPLALSAAAQVMTAHPSLVILPCLDFNLLPALLEDNSSAPAVLLACRPRWPLRRLLLIVRGDAVDDAALAWAVRLAAAGDVVTTALMIAPHATPSTALPAPNGVSDLLSPNNAVGRRMQHAAQRLAAMHLDAVLHLRQGAPDQIIRQELIAAPYDLAIAGVAVRGVDVQWRLRPLLHRLWSDLNCPLLFTACR